MSIRLIHGDCRDMLPTLPAESVHCCVTSPPYFGLRDYGTAQWDGGDPACGHTGKRSIGTSTLMNDGRATIGLQADHKYATVDVPYRDICGLCGATRIDRQIGLEPTPDAFVAELVEVFRAVRRVLRNDGTVWLNLGDSYANTRGGKEPGLYEDKRNAAATWQAKIVQLPPGLKPKDLIGIPWRVAFALQADGWYLRSDIIWSKPNPMPESVTDRPTKAHEYLFLLAKSERYYYDNDAVREPYSEASLGRYEYEFQGSTSPGRHKPDNKDERYKQRSDHQPNPSGRNRRSVWTVTTEPFSEAHFATFPPALIEPCILAGCPPGGTVLDPFSGAGTTGLVADRLQRSAVLIELNPKYSDMAERRITDDGPLFADVAAIRQTLEGA